MLKDFTPRLYQQSIFASASKHNTLVVLPTGLGKTAIAMMLATLRRRNYPGSKILFLAPTRPLVNQHLSSFKKHITLDDDEMAAFTGMIDAKKREALFKAAHIVFSTPQGLENDIINRRISLKDISLLVFDEAHRATGNYSYTFLAKRYMQDATHPLILALSASPGGDEEAIQTVMDNLHLEHIEVRDDTDPDVKASNPDTAVEQVMVELNTELRQTITHLRTAYKEKMAMIRQLGYLRLPPGNISKSTLLKMQRQTGHEVSQGGADYATLKTLSLLAECLKIEHALELVESQGLTPFISYYTRTQEDIAKRKTKAAQNFLADPNVRAAHLIAENTKNKGIDHPKLLKVRSMVKDVLQLNPKGKIIIFDQYRDQAEVIKAELDSQGHSAELFFGQMKKNNSGMSQKKQQALIEEFRAGTFSCLIATSVAEEGLDIPEVDLVIFYEPVPSAIRTVQRRGRTGRQKEGQVKVLIAKGTRDEAYRWSAHHKEKRMYAALRSIQRTHPATASNHTKRESTRTNPTSSTVQQTLPTPSQTKASPKEPQGIVVDYREKNSSLLSSIMDAGHDVTLTQLEVGDYLISDTTCIEYKTESDFVDSIIDGRLLSQARELRKYPKALILIEGDSGLFAHRNIHPNAIRGMLLTLAVTFQIPLLYSRNTNESAQIMTTLLNRERSNEHRVQYHQTKPLSTAQQQHYVISTLPGVGSALAKKLLNHFGSVHAIFNAELDALKTVEGIGERKAQSIHDLIHQTYTQDQKETNKENTRQMDEEHATGESDGA